MIRLLCLVVALCGLIYVRATSYTQIPVWTLMWWVWISATCLVAGCIGWVGHEIRHRDDRDLT